MTNEGESQRRATIDDVVAHAGVSRAVVSKVIRGAYGVNASMRERVEAAIEELDYRAPVAAQGAHGATFTLGMELPDVYNQFFAKILAGATAALDTEPYQLIVAQADPDHHEGYRALEALLDRHVDGLVAVSPLVDPQWLERIARRLPLVMLGRHDPSVGYDTVVGDDLLGTRMVMTHLFELGHRRIVHLTHDAEIARAGSRTPHGLRLAAYESAMREAGLESSIRIVRCGIGEDASYEATKRMLGAHNLPTAIFAGHDELALGVLRAVAERGLLEQISVVGYDNTKFAGHPLVSLTSVDQAGERMGRLVVALLLERIAGRTDAVHQVMKPRLIPRSSTRAIDAQGSVAEM